MSLNSIGEKGAQYLADALKKNKVILSKICFLIRRYIIHLDTHRIKCIFKSNW